MYLNINGHRINAPKILTKFLQSGKITPNLVTLIGDEHKHTIVRPFPTIHLPTYLPIHLPTIYLPRVITNW